MLDAVKLIETWLEGGMLITDGAWGTELQARGIALGHKPG